MWLDSSVRTFPSSHVVARPSKLPISRARMPGLELGQLAAPAFDVAAPSFGLAVEGPVGNTAAASCRRDAGMDHRQSPVTGTMLPTPLN